MSHIGVSGFQSGLWLLPAASCKYRSWETLIMAPNCLRGPGLQLAPTQGPSSWLPAQSRALQEFWGVNQWMGPLILSLSLSVSHILKKGQLLFMQKMSAISEKFFSPNTFFMNFKKSVVLGRAGVGRGRETCLPSVYSSDVCGGPGPGNSQEPCIPLGSPWWVAGTGYALAGSRICSECGTQTCDRDALSQVAP